MSLILKTTSAPIPFEPARGDEAAALFGDAPDNIVALIRGVAGCSPYLRALIHAEAGWLVDAMAADAPLVLAGIRAMAAASGLEKLGPDLRRAKRRIALYTALADTGGMWTLAEVTAALTDFADFAVQTTLAALVGAEIARGKLPGCDAPDVASACGMVVLAMGKMGAHELNYSSDIDLIVLFDERRHAPEHFDLVRERFIRITKRMARMLSDVTSDGYVFRTDLRLRPDPSVTPVCLSMYAAERYYESLGRTWERAAFIKARACAGDIRAGQEFLETLHPFVWRKHLDYAAIEDAHDMRLRIREHKGLGGAVSLPGHNMKLGRGGIREIEFFTQTRQIIAGGRDADLQLRGTVEGLSMLATKGWIGRDTADDLIRAYRAHRIVEHRIQMLHDTQTHTLPGSAEQMQRLACFCGFGDVGAFSRDITARLQRVHALTEGFFAPGRNKADPLAGLPPNMIETIEQWHALPALRSQRAGGIFATLLPLILARTSRSSDPARTLAHFGRFLAGLPAGVQLFSMFQANPHLIDLLVDICGSAPGLADYLSRNAGVFDAVIGGTFFAPLPDEPRQRRTLADLLAGFDDYEAQLNAARRWMKEQHFRIGVQHLKQMIDSEKAAAHYSDLAEATLRALLPVVAAQFGRRHGLMPGRGAMVLGMGSLGAQSLTATSDLDLIVIYDAQGYEMSDGRRPLPVSTYYTRLTQALMTALSSPMADGTLYEVDMRLRPSGRKGPVATPLSGFISYQRNNAWTWEHLALTRARPVAGNAGLSAEVEAFRRQIVTRQRDLSKTLKDVSAMRARLAAAVDKRQLADPWEAKNGPGRMLDIELLAQTAALLARVPVRDVNHQLATGVTLGWYAQHEADSLKMAYGRWRNIRQIGRLLLNGRFDPANLGQDGCDLLLAQTGATTIKALSADLDRASGMAASLIERCLAART